MIMKKIFFALTMLALVLPAIPRANGAELTVNLFYDNLSGGNWIDADEYGYGWQPDVAANDSDWRPYADGYWAYTDYGWTWISYEDFGWATYHYGRWARLADYGWVWFPGSDLEWGPAWVSWRFGGNYCGWAPLPPRGPGIVYDGRPIGGHVDIEFDIGPAYYNFVDIRYVGEPVLRSHIYAPSYNVTYVNQTVNVTNITVKNKIVYNYGPSYEVLSKHSARPIQRLKIERETNVDFSTAAKSGRLTKVQGDKLMLGAPQNIERSSKTIAPPKVKTKLARDKVKLEHGWSVAGDEKAQTELKQKIKTQDLKKIPPPTEGTSGQAENGASPGETSAASQAEKDKHRRPGESADQTASPARESSPEETSMTSGRGKQKDKKEEVVGGPPTVPEPMNPPGGTKRNVGKELSKGKGKDKNLEPGVPVPPDEMNPATGRLGGKRKMMPPEPAAGETAASEIEQGAGQGKMKKKMGVPPTAPEPINPPGSAQGNSRKRGPGMNPPGGPVSADVPGGEQRGGGKHEGKKKGAHESPTPGP